MDGELRLEADDRTTGHMATARQPDTAGGEAADKAGDKAAQAPANGRRRGPPKWILLVAVLVIAVGGTFYWYQGRNYVSTSDAQIDGALHQIAPQTGGRVIAVPVRTNQHVAAGQPLLKIDPRDEQVQLDKALAQQANAQAQLANSQALVGLRQASVDQSSADLAVQQANQVQAQQDYQRYRGINPRAITRQQLDNAAAALRAATARVDAGRQAVKGAKAQVTAAEASVVAAQASLKSADVAIEQARLQLSYTTVTAPVAGYVTMKSVRLGNVVKNGQALMDVVADDVWVTANFKETALSRLRVGQPVSISVDAYPGKTFHGHIQSFQRGTGSVFSLLPAENATGNYVKVVQRVPVKIVFDHVDFAKYRLSPGMSVEPSVKVR
ncbi:MAG TPA: HlyD family secretion protein [Acetobacteraceae bacterium]|nr:HlyD family secretion protein [Acetobacteraceae bacterium]